VSVSMENELGYRVNARVDLESGTRVNLGRE